MVYLNYSVSLPEPLKKDSRSADAATIRQAANATALREVVSQMEQFWFLGVMADWNSKKATYRTLGECSLASLLKTE